MSKTEDRILDHLRRHPEGVDDDNLALALGFSQRQQANQYCRRMQDKGLVERRTVDGKIRNFFVGGVPVRQEPSPAGPTTSAGSLPPANPGGRAFSEAEPDRPWYWEGNVQNAVVAHLSARGFTILRTANTASREPGKDIEARKGTHCFWVTVKGYPEKTANTQSSTQAGHWFKDALFDIIAYRGEDPEAGLAMALPDFPRYRRLAEKVAWLQPVARYVYLWVNEEGSVQVEG